MDRAGAGAASAGLNANPAADRRETAPAEADETLLVNLSGASGAVVADSQAAAIVADDDPLPVLTVAPASVAEGTGDAATLSFAVSLSAPSGRTVTVQYSTGDGTATAGSDYVAKSGTLTFLAGITQQTVNVSLVGEAAAEADETLSLVLSTPTWAAIGSGIACPPRPFPRGRASHLVSFASGWALGRLVTKKLLNYYRFYRHNEPV